MNKKAIELVSQYGVILKNEYIDQESDILAVILPGQSYINYAPLMHYSYKTALELGVDVLCIDYGFQTSNKEFNYETELSIIIEESLQILKKCLDKKYNRILFIGKSIGTIIQNKLSKELTGFQQTHVYLTPVNETFEDKLDAPCLIITGTMDAKIDNNLIDKAIENKNYELIKIHNGNHSLESRDTLESIEMLRKVMAILREFIVDKLCEGRQVNTNL